MGTVRCFDLPTGKLLDLSDRKRTEIVAVVRKDAEQWIESGKPYDRSRGITLLGALRVKEAVPAAKRALHRIEAKPGQDSDRYAPPPPAPPPPPPA